MNELSKLSDMLAGMNGTVNTNTIKWLCMEYVQGATIASLVQIELLECGSVYLLYLEPGEKQGTYKVEYAIDFLIEDDYKKGTTRRLFANWMKETSERCWKCDRVHEPILRILNAKGDQESVYIPHQFLGTTYTILPI